MEGLLWLLGVVATILPFFAWRRAALAERLAKSQAARVEWLESELVELEARPAGSGQIYSA